jgi:ABC-2 type transport system ATP-binding protein
MKPSVEVTDLWKYYGKHLALQELSFTVGPGCIYGLIGPNGAGKTTSLSILAGLVSPTAGSVLILGMDVRPNRSDLVSKVGFASPQLSFFDYLSGAELMVTCGLMHGLKAGEAKSRMKDLLALLDLEEAAGHYLYQYSYGMRQKLGLACALIHAPEVLLLDEPFIGLDPTSIYRISRTLKQVSAHGHTVVLTSHNLALVERLCDRVGILHEGNLKREIDPAAAAGKTSEQAGAESGLESALWEVVGTPEFEELSWI